MKTILIVDDSLTIQRVLRHTLQRVGYHVQGASNGAEALSHLVQAHASERLFDLAIIDLSMPDVNGFDLLQGLRRDDRFSRLPVIMLTGSGMLTDRTQAQEKGANAFLNKPVSSSELLDCVSTVLGAPVGEDVA